MMPETPDGGWILDDAKDDVSYRDLASSSTPTPPPVPEQPPAQKPADK